MIRLRATVCRPCHSERSEESLLRVLSFHCATPSPGCLAHTPLQTQTDIASLRSDDIPTGRLKALPDA